MKRSKPFSHHPSAQKRAFFISHTSAAYLHSFLFHKLISIEKKTSQEIVEDRKAYKLQLQERHDLGTEQQQNLSTGVSWRTQRKKDASQVDFFLNGAVSSGFQFVSEKSSLEWDCWPPPAIPQSI